MGDIFMEDQKEVTQQGNVDSSDDFFSIIEDQVNGAIYDTAEESSSDGPEQVTQKKEEQKVGVDEWESEDNPYKKRYGDSTKEAQKLNDEIKTLKPFVPILEAMKKDNNLVEYVKDYLLKGGAPAPSIQENLGVDEDFEFNGTEAIKNPESDSAKVLDAHVDELVKRRIKQMVQGQMKNVKAANMAEDRRTKEAEFKLKHKMTDEEFAGMVEKAKKHTMSLDDIYYLTNRDKIDSNIADSARADVMKQMKNVQDIPKTIGSVNSLGKTSKSDDDSIFDSILSSERNLDSLFG